MKEATVQMTPRPLTREGTAPERFWSKVKFTESCWLWGGYLLRGYGCFDYGNRSVHSVQRYAYEFRVGPIPEGLTIDHLCRVRNCVNPDHLDPVTLCANILRGTSPSAKNARITHCPQGHPYDGPNLQTNARGWRYCRTCRKTQRRTRYERERASIN